MSTSHIRSPGYHFVCKENWPQLPLETQYKFHTIDLCKALQEEGVLMEPTNDKLSPKVAHAWNRLMTFIYKNPQFRSNLTKMTPSMGAALKSGSQRRIIFELCSLEIRNTNF